MKTKNGDKIIDVSKFQGQIDWSQVASSGVKGTIIKIINKTNAKDDRFEENYRGATANSLPVGVYNYSYATTVAKAKQDAVVVVSALAGRKAPLGVWIDIEDQCQMNLGAGLIDIILTYKEIIVGAGYTFGVYTYEDFYTQWLKKYKEALTMPFWVAKVPDKKNVHEVGWTPLPLYKPRIDSPMWAWQYSWSTQVNGVASPCDCSVIYAAVPSFDEEVILEKDKIEPASIRNIQAWLNKYYGANIIVHDSYGPLTKKALVKAFQHEIGIYETGVFDKDTEYCSPVLGIGSKGMDVFVMKCVLFCKGYKVGLSSKELDAECVDAILDFGLSTNGRASTVIDGKFFKRLFR